MLVFLVFLGYAPALFTQFGINVDYLFLDGNFQERTRIEEFSHLYLIGREAWAFLLSWQSWFINELWIMPLVRWGMAGLLLLFLFFFQRFLSSVGFKGKAAWLVLACIAFLPESHVMTVHLYMLSGGFPVLLMALGSYYLLEKNLFFSALLFLAGLFIYQSNAAFVFVGTAIYVLKNFLEGKSVPWRRIGRDCLVYVLLMGAYYLLHKYIFLKMMPVATNYSPIGSRYEFAATFAFLGKMGLMADLFVVSLSGMLHTVFFNYAAIFGFLVLASGHIVLARLTRKGAPFSFLAAMAVLFALMNAPSLMAKNCYQAYGYRVLFAPAVMLLLWQAMLWIKIYDLTGAARIRTALRAAGVLFCLASFFVPLRALALACDGFHQELLFIRRQVDKIDWRQISSVAVIAQEEGDVNFTGHHLAYEYSVPSRYTNLVRYFARKKGVVPLPGVYEIHGSVFYRDPRTAVIDVQSAWPAGAKSSFENVLIFTSNGYPGDVIINRAGNRVFTFSQIVGTKELPFWHVDLGGPKPVWIEMDPQEGPRTLKNLSFGVFSAETASVEKILCLVAASNDGRNWERYQLESPKAFRQYRFVLVPAGEARVFNVGAILMDLDW